MNVSVTEENTCSFPLHCHDEEEIALYLAGEGYMRANGEKLPFKPGTILVIPRGVVHGSVSDKSFKNVCLYFDFPEAKKATAVSDVPSGFIAAAIRAAYDYYYARRDVSLSLVEPLRKALFERISASRGEVSAVERVYLEIRERFCDPSFSLAAAVKSAHLSDDYFRQAFKAAYGAPPLRLLTAMRMDKARGMLNKGVFTVSETAYACGYDDPLYFSRVYKNFYGVAPKEDRLCNGKVTKKAWE